MIRKLFKWLAGLFVVSALAGIGYLALQPDPGPYLVALRSDTPESVDKAIAALEGDTSIYNGTYSSYSIEDLQALGRRLHRKATGQSAEPLIGDAAVWHGFSRRVVDLIRARQVQQNSQESPPKP